jgi:hypothetical protein
MHCIFSGYEARRYPVKVQRFVHCLSLHHQGLMWWVTGKLCVGLYVGVGVPFLVIIFLRKPDQYSVLFRNLMFIVSLQTLAIGTSLESDQSN